MKKIINSFLFFLIFSGIIFVYLFWKFPDENIILNIRLPRLILTFFVGFVLSGVGNIYQLILNNPLAEPYTLGISSGAALGSIIATVSGLYFLAPVSGFIFALITMFLVWKIATVFGDFNSIRLILSGIIVGMFLSAFISIIIYFNKKDVGAVFQILMGNTGIVFTRNEWHYFLIIFIFSIILMIYLYSLATKINILTTGDLLATSMGIDVVSLKRRIFVITSILVGITVSYAGIIGFVGLVVPHLTRMVFKRNIKFHIILSSIIGAFFLIICDFIASHIAVIEIPIGIVTAFIGTPFFVYLMIKKDK